MKKILLSITIFLVAFNINAQDLTIHKVVNEIVIDGQVDALWDLVDQVDLQYEPDDDYGPASINEGWFKMVWNDTALIMLIRRSDDDFATQWDTGLEDWKSDRDEIFFDVNVDTLNDGRGASDSQNGASYGHYQFTSIWVENSDEWVGNPNQWYHNAPFTFGYVIDGDDYYTEYLFPFSSLTIDTDLLPTADATFQGAIGVQFGLQISMNDVDLSDNPTDETFRKFLKWNDAGGWTTMDSAGVVLMGGGLGLRDDPAADGIFVYPSPTSGFIQLIGITKAVQVEIFDVAGNLIYTDASLAANAKIDVTSLKGGVYFIRIVDSITKKFIKN